MPVGLESALRHVLFHSLHPKPQKALCPAKTPAKAEINTLYASGGLLVFQACQRLFELALGENTSLVLPANPLGLVVALAALI